jgi:1,4-dihydroxy-2-naphthoyl-CoA hydrolase
LDQIPVDYASALNKSPDGWTYAIGLTYVRATADEVVGELEVSEQHRKADGVVDEGIYGGLFEAAASVGAALYASRWKRPVVGVENQTSFLGTIHSGRIRVTATPVQRDRDTQVWDGSVTDSDGRLVATGRLRLICLEEDSGLKSPVLEALGL